MKELHFWPDKILNEVALPVETFDDELIAYVEEMFDLMYHFGGIGLAANQVGDALQILVIDTTPADGGDIKREFINPRIMWKSEETIIAKEGCLSFPGAAISVPRHDTVGVEAEDRFGITFSVVAHGIDAICLQHEMDHLQGITFYDRLSPVKRKLHKKKFERIKTWRKKNGI